MATMNTSLAPLRDRGAVPSTFTLAWEALPQPPRTPVRGRPLGADMAADLQAAADAALAELFPALRLRAGALARA